MKTKILILVSVLALMVGVAALVLPTITSVEQVNRSVVISGVLDCNKYTHQSSITTTKGMINVSIVAVDPSPYVECGNPKPFTIGLNPPKGTWRIYVNGKYWLTFK